MAHVISNRSGNRPFHNVLRVMASRRQLIAGGMVVAATGFLGAATVAANGWENGKPENAYRPRRRDLMRFRPVPVEDGGRRDVVVSADYEFQVLIPWGDPLEPGGPQYLGQPDRRPSAREQTEMIGIGPESLEDVRLSQHAHGVAVVAIGHWKGRWRQLASRNSRRIHVNTPMGFSGPVAGHALLQTPSGNIALGTVNNCAGGHTPWGTYLTCEENFNGYFGASDRETTWLPTEEQSRYGFSADGFGYGWHLFDRRFDLSDPDYRNEENRFGWVVEIDPFDATRTPVKRTALGRFKHEGAEVAEGAGGRAVVYMGDDERFDYVYRFVYRRRLARHARAA